MTVGSINSYSRLSDALERDLMQAAYSVNRAYSVVEGLQIAGKTISRAAAAAGRYLIQLAEALNEARARDARFSGSQW